MTNIEFFKLQSKNFLKDFETKQYNEVEGLYEYQPRFFSDIDEIALHFNIEENDSFSLMNAQHIIARLSGFDKWNDLIKSSESALELGKLLLTNRQAYENSLGFFTNIYKDSMIVDDWKRYESENLKDFDDDSKLEVFKKVFLNEYKPAQTNKRPVITFNFENDKNAQDMLMKIMKHKNLPPDKAILSTITQKNCIRIIETGYSGIALSLWGHDNPYREWEKLDDTTVKFKLNKDKEHLVNIIMKKEEVNFPTAVLYFMLYSLESLGYHI